MSTGARGQTWADVLDAVYALDLSDEEWLTGILSRLETRLDGGMGALAWCYERQGASVRLWGLVGRGPDGWAESLHECAAAATSDVLAMYDTGPIVTLLGRLGRGVWSTPLYKQSLQPIGIVDTFAINAMDPTGCGCIFTGPTAVPVTVVHPDSLALERVAAHIAAAFRVRRALVSEASDSVEAVCELSGAVVHAEPAAQSKASRTALRRAAVAIDRVRSTRHRADPEALAAWEALVLGRWSLVDLFERDGRHYLVARKNAPVSPEHPPLTEREKQVAAFAAVGHSTKLIAYELGLSTSVVGTCLTRAMTKLGVSSRVELAPILGWAGRKRKSEQ